MMRMVEVIIAVGILAAGIAGIYSYLYTQPTDVQPKTLSAQAYTALQAVEADVPLTCSASQRQLVLEALYVLLPPNTYYNFTVYTLAGSRTQQIYSVANSAQADAPYKASVTVALDTPATPQPPGSKLGVQQTCFATLTVGETQ